jgi:hypothetical protein
MQSFVTSVESDNELPRPFSLTQAIALSGVSKSRVNALTSIDATFLS